MQYLSLQPVSELNVYHHLYCPYELPSAQLLRTCMLKVWERQGESSRSADSDIKINWMFCIKMIRSELVFGAIFYKKLHDFLFINFGGKFCNIRLNFSTQKIFTKVGHDISLKGEELHQLYVFERYFSTVGMRS